MTSTNAIALTRALLEIQATPGLSERQRVHLILAALRLHKVIDGSTLVQTLDEVQDYYERHVTRTPVVRDSLTGYEESLDIEEGDK